MTEISPNIVATSIAVAIGLGVALILWWRAFLKDDLTREVK